MLADFDEFSRVPDIQPDVLKTVAIKLPFGSRKTMLSLKAKRYAAEAADAERAAKIRQEQDAKARKSPVPRKPSQEELQLLRTSPR